MTGRKCCLRVGTTWEIDRPKRALNPRRSRTTSAGGWSDAQILPIAAGTVFPVERITAAASLSASLTAFAPAAEGFSPRSAIAARASVISRARARTVSPDKVAINVLSFSAAAAIAVP